MAAVAGNGPRRFIEADEPLQEQNGQISLQMSRRKKKNIKADEPEADVADEPPKNEADAPQDSEIQIMIQAMNGSCSVVTVRKRHSGKQLRRTVAGRLSAQMSELNLQYNGARLNDNDNLESIGIEDWSVVQIVAAFRGSSGGEKDKLRNIQRMK